MTGTIGNVLLVLALVSGAASVVLAVRREARRCQVLLLTSTGLLLAAAALLTVALVQCNFRLNYVVGHTSLTTPLPYRLAALWAGQEGTVLFWALLIQLVACSLLRRDLAARLPAAAVTSVSALGLMALLLVHSPFAAVAGPPPDDGMGLNPLLLNPWMLVHPPVLFIGYALLVAPYALALVAWWRHEPDAWIAPARPWLLAGWVLLGAGQMLGGYWAYITLGWGGFWAWDPVENASLIPWLFATAALHGLPLQRRAGACRRFNFLMVALTHILIVYGSYLTRSGLLANLSVHSFQSLGQTYNAAWLAYLLVVALPPVVLLFGRRPPAGRVDGAQGYLLQGAWLLAAMAVFVAVGTSAPLVLGESALETGFHNRTQTVLFGLVCVTIVLLLAPATTTGRVLMIVATGVSAAGAARLIAPEYDQITRLALSLLAGLCGAVVAIGLHKAVRAGRAGRLGEVGVGLAHTGMAWLVLGAVLSGPGQRSEQVQLALGQPVNSAKTGLTVTLASAHERPDERLDLALTVGEGPGAKTGVAQMYQTRNGLMRHPALFLRPTGDAYLEPLELTSAAVHAHGDMIELRKGEATSVEAGELTFVAFDLSSGHGDPSQPAMMSVGVKLTLVTAAGETIEATPQFVVAAEGNTSPVTPLGDHEVRVVAIDASSGRVGVELTGEGGAAEGHDEALPGLLLQVTWKPLIGFVWLGTILCLLGGVLAWQAVRVGQWSEQILG